MLETFTPSRPGGSLTVRIDATAAVGETPLRAAFPHRWGHDETLLYRSRCAERGPLRTGVDAVAHGLGELASPALKTHQSATFRPCWSCHQRPVGPGRLERAVVTAQERERLTLPAGAR